MFFFQSTHFLFSCFIKSTITKLIDASNLKLYPTAMIHRPLFPFASSSLSLNFFKSVTRICLDYRTVLKKIFLSLLPPCVDINFFLFFPLFSYFFCLSTIRSATKNYDTRLLETPQQHKFKQNNRIKRNHNIYAVSDRY